MSAYPSASGLWTIKYSPYPGIYGPGSVTCVTVMTVMTVKTMVWQRSYKNEATATIRCPDPDPSSESCCCHVLSPVIVITRLALLSMECRHTATLLSLPLIPIRLIPSSVHFYHLLPFLAPIPSLVLSPPVFRQFSSPLSYLSLLLSLT